MNNNVNIIIGSDHAGFDLKEICKEHLENLSDFVVADIGVFDRNSSDYPKVANKLAQAIARGDYRFGILICGTGLGMSIAANRHKGVRAALCNDLYTVKMSRLHNDANILVLGARVIGDVLAVEVVKTWLETPFEGGRHSQRLEKFDTI